ncbi:hypothetical protein UFOVP1451_41 [uncultured Caudovirales phage]|uniref:Uncharacterized protein n=1 Tax=uncultured Caudovirales phage TaxID=2100421 RepID=A0A6J5SGL6_9CAUD|nr:hypothetical protein UFOVP1451_41 [uncultured Caudovirales phage]
MLDTQNQVHIKQFSDDIIQAVQQKNSRLDGTVQRKIGVSAEEFYFNKLGSVELQEKTQRYSPTPLVDPVHSKRKVVPTRFHQGISVDDYDQDRALVSLQPNYMEMLMYAAKRKKDEIIIGALGGTAYEGKDGTTAVALPSAQKIVSSSAAMTLAKLLSAKEIMDAADVDEEIARYIVLSAKQVTNLLNTTEIKNADYNTVKALAEGKIDTFLGFKFIRTQKLLTNASSERLCYAYTEKAVGIAINKDMKTKVGENPDKSFATVAYIELDMGATRVEDKEVVEIACTE